MIGNMVGGFIIIFVSISLFGTIQEASNTYLALFVVAIAIVTAIVSMYTAWKMAFSDDDTEYEELEPVIKKPKKPHKQTYKEYVAERLYAEREMK